MKLGSLQMLKMTQNYQLNQVQVEYNLQLFGVLMCTSITDFSVYLHNSHFLHTQFFL